MSEGSSAVSPAEETQTTTAATQKREGLSDLVGREASPQNAGANPIAFQITTANATHSKILEFFAKRTSSRKILLREIGP